MSRKIKVTGKSVIYTKDGAKVLDSEVRRYFNVNYDSNRGKFNFDGDYLLIGHARFAPKENIYSAEPHPEYVDQMLRFAKSKFFRLMLDLQRAAQWDPINKNNFCIEADKFHNNAISTYAQRPIDFDADIDSQLFVRFGFTPQMIDWINKHYDDL